MKRHTHRTKTRIVRPFFSPVRWEEKSAAHGGSCLVDTCRCGAVRKTNVNGVYTERGPWVEQSS